MIDPIFTIYRKQAYGEGPGGAFGPRDGREGLNPGLIPFWVPIQGEPEVPWGLEPIERWGLDQVNKAFEGRLGPNSSTNKPGL